MCAHLIFQILLLLEWPLLSNILATSLFPSFIAVFAASPILVFTMAVSTALPYHLSKPLWICLRCSHQRQCPGSLHTHNLFSPGHYLNWDCMHTCSCIDVQAHDCGTWFFFFLCNGPVSLKCCVSVNVCLVHMYTYSACTPPTETNRKCWLPGCPEDVGNRLYAHEKWNAWTLLCRKHDPYDVTIICAHQWL